jgi:hypothetical protein
MVEKLKIPSLPAMVELAAGKTVKISPVASIAEVSAFLE